MRFGILGDAKISRNQIIPAMQENGFSLVHLGTREPKRPKSLEHYSFSKIGRYDDVLSNPEVEAVYIPLPNHLHAEWSIKALNAGKHVLCEKPMALTLSEIDAVEKAAKLSNCYFQEAFMVRSHPQWEWLKKIKIGDALHISAIFSYPPRPDGDIRNFARMGGGPVWDIACYTALAGILIFESAPQLLFCNLQMDPNLDVEKDMNALLDFGHGKRLYMHVSSAMGLSQCVHVTTQHGWARLDAPFNPIERATASWSLGNIGEGTKKIFEPCNQYAFMLKNFKESCDKKAKPCFKQSKQIISLLNQILDFRN